MEKTDSLFIVAGMAVCIFALASVGAYAATYRVPSEYETIQQAVEMCTHGDTVLVAAGTYSGTGNKNLDFGAVNLVLVSEAGAALTTIDCEGSGRAFYLHGGEDETAAIIGFTVTNATPGGSAHGAIYCSGSSPTIRECIVTGNATEGIYGGPDRIVDCLISDNALTGVYASGISTITGCEITGNNPYGIGYGGGIMVASGSVLISDCTITGNEAYSGGGIHIYATNVPVAISGCTISANTALTGAGISAGFATTFFTVTNCTISGNSAEGKGGGLYAATDHLTISDTDLIGNSAPKGAGIYCGGSVAITDCLITGNRAEEDGGGVYCDTASPTLTGCTISGNLAATGDGGGFYAYGASFPQLVRCIVWSNCASGLDRGYEIRALGASSLTFSCSLVDSTRVDGPGEFVWQEDNLFIDPLFCNHADCWSAPETGGDYALASGGGCSSPCLATNSPCGQQIGVEGPGSCGCTSTVTTSWGRVKLLYR